MTDDRELPVAETLSSANEELRTWRIRALQAEAEVRSLKRTRHAERPQAESDAFGQLEGQKAETRVDFGIQTELGEASEFQSAEARERLRSSPFGSDSPSEIEELRQQLKQRDTAIVQLQADSHREHQSKQRKAVEQQQVYREELREMTQRAESLMDQLRKSKKSGKEMQAAQKSAREEFLTARLELQECQAQLRRQVFVPSQSSEAFAEVREARVSEKEADSATTEPRAWTTKDVGEDTLGRSFPVVEHWRGVSDAPRDEVAVQVPIRLAGQQARVERVTQCFGTLRKLHSELSKELQSRPTGQAAAEDVISKILQQMDKALLDGPSPAGSEGGRAASLSLRLPPSSPEAERPVPEDLKDFKLSSASGSPQDPGRDSDEVLLMKLDVNTVRVAAELEKEKLIAEHCDELDDLVRRHDKERRKLHQELSELRSEQLRSEASEKPMQHIRAHLEKQVAEVKCDLVAQLADINERNRMQNGQVEQEMSLLKRDLERCQAELSASQKEFRTLALLYDKEQQELQDLRQQQHSSGDSKTLIVGDSM